MCRYYLKSWTCLPKIIKISWCLLKFIKPQLKHFVTWTVRCVVCWQLLTGCDTHTHTSVNCVVMVFVLTCKVLGLTCKVLVLGLRCKVLVLEKLLKSLSWNKSLSLEQVLFKRLWIKLCQVQSSYFYFWFTCPSSVNVFSFSPLMLYFRWQKGRLA